MSRNPREDLVAVIPAFEAAVTIADVVRGALRHVPRVVVVDDGSGDGTAARAEAAGAEVLRHASNRGKGVALKTAFDRLLRGAPAPGGEPPVPPHGGERPRPGWDGVVTLDADGQHDPDDIPRLAELFRSRRPAIVVGSRAGSFEAMWGPRRAMNRFSSASLRFFSAVDLPDSQSGFRLYSRAFLERFRPRGRRYEVEVEALMQAAAWRMSIATMPIRMSVADGRVTSHYRPVADTFRIIRAVLGHWARARFLRDT